MQLCCLRESATAPLLWVCACGSVCVSAAAVRPRGALLELMLAGAEREEAERERVASTNKVGGVC